MDVNIGLTEEQRKGIAGHLGKLLADTYALYVKTQSFHWNVTGIHFHSLHLLFEGHYVELAAAIDLIAERIRALGVLAPAGFSVYASLSEVKESPVDLKAEAMITQLVLDHEICIRTARAALSLADEANDQPTLDLLTQRMQIHEKTAWMLRSMLEGSK